MANTYGGDPENDTSDAVRFHLGDTDLDDFLFHDYEVTYALSKESDDVYAATAYLCSVQATRLANKRDRTVGPLSITYDQQYQRWSEESKRYATLSRNGSNKGRPKAASAELFGGGSIYSGLDDTPLTYDEGELGS